MKTVVIIGGGFAGTYAAKKLQKDFNVTLIDTKDYFEFTPGILRSVIKPERLKKIQTKHKGYLNKAKIVVGKVSEINKKSVKVNNRKIYFDYLIVSSGSNYNALFKEQNVVNTSRSHHLVNYSQKLKKANRVLIIGGGPVGVEMAGEICWAFKGRKKVLLVHAGERLIERNPKKASEYVQYFLAKRGVEIVFNEKVVKNESGVFTTDKGGRIEADLAFLCTGLKPNFELFRENYEKKIDSHGFVKVNSCLQLNTSKNIFVAGDINDLPQEKTAQNAQLQAKRAVQNILSLEKNKPLKAYSLKRTPLVISLGKFNGLYINNYFVMTGKVPALMKYLIERFEMARRGVYSL